MLKRNNFFRNIVAFAVIFSGLSQLSATASTDPKAFVEVLASSAFATLRDPAMSEKERFDKFRTLLSQNVDLARIGRFVLGSHWKQADPAQQEEFQNLFRDYVIASYAGRLKDYTEATVEVKEATPNGSNEYIVTTHVTSPGNPEPVRVDWRLREDGGKLHVIDMTIEGISMALTQRSEFSSLIQQNGGDVNVLLARLRSVSNEIEAGKPITVKQ